MRNRSRLKVPLFEGTEGLPYCGPTCMKMVLAYFGRSCRVSIEKIADGLPMWKKGVDMASIGTYFLRRGFDVKIVMWLPNFPNRFISLPAGEVKNEILQWCKRKEVNDATELGRHRIFRKTLPVFIKNGGKVIPRPVSIQELKQAIKCGQPPILNINTRLLYRFQRMKYAGHYVVPISINQKGITINDPNEYKPKTYPPEILMFSCYSWSAGAIFIKPK